MSTEEQRPAINSVASSAELQRWYWLKTELADYARSKGISANCQKMELVRRIGVWLDAGVVVGSVEKKKTSKFDWRKETLQLDTTITDSYANTQNVRQFMNSFTDGRFKFSNEFMDWMAKNSGKSLADAIEFWRELDSKKREQGYREQPLPQNQYNQFARALSEVSKGITAEEIRRKWAIKRSRPAPHVYKPGDENL